MLIHGQDLACGEGIQLRQQDAERGPVASEGLVGNEVVRYVLSAQLHSSLALGQGICLCEEIAHELVVVGHHFSLRYQPGLGGRCM